MANKLFESKWAATKEALLEGLTGSRRDSLGVVLENTRKHLTESASAGATAATESSAESRRIDTRHPPSRHSPG